MKTYFMSLLLLILFAISPNLHAQQQVWTDLRANFVDWSSGYPMPYPMVNAQFLGSWQEQLHENYVGGNYTSWTSPTCGLGLFTLTSIRLNSTYLITQLWGAPSDSLVSGM